MTLARDLGDGPHRPFGSALPASVEKRMEPIPRITVRPVRPRAAGLCPGCGDRFFGCGCEDGADG